MRKDLFAAAVCDQRETLLRRVRPLDDHQWDLVCPSPAPPADVVRLDEPRRTIRQVVAHVLVVDELVLRGGTVRAARGLPRLEHPGGWDLRRIDPLAAAPAPELVDLLARRGKRVARLVSAAPAAAHRVPVPGPFGRQPLGRQIGRRVLHEWLHGQDIAAALGTSDAHASAAVAGVLADSVLQLLPVRALPATGLNAGVLRIVVDVAGTRGPTDDGRRAGAGEPARPTIWGVDFARRQYGPRVVRPADATIRLTAQTLALLAHGRGDRVDPRSAVDVEGDQGLAATLLQSLESQAAAAPSGQDWGAAAPATAGELAG